MAPDYSCGMIYELYDKNTNEMLYIGSTINKLYKRLGQHKEKSKICPERPIYKYVIENGIEYGIRLIEEFNCENKQQLCQREGYYQRLYKDKIHNVVINGRTRQEWCEDNLEYMIEYQKVNADKISEYKKKYNQVYREKNKEYMIEYQKVNADKISEYQKEYYEINKNEISEYQKQQVNCEYCNKLSTRRNLKRHQNTSNCSLDLQSLFS